MRFIHTADWQLGLKLNFIPGEAGARARSCRYETVRRIAELAHERQADAVVVAGDVLDDNAVGPDTLQQASDAMATFAPIPLLLLPGNHDAATADSALERLGTGEHVTVMADAAPITVGDTTFHPCPVKRRLQSGNLTAQLPERADADGFRVAVAHGGAIQFERDTELPAAVDVSQVLQKGFDFLALGDWHGTLPLNARAWYSGTPEPTRFKEQNPGNVLVVDLPEPGAEPVVETVPVARTRWIQREQQFHQDEDFTAFRDWLETLPERAWTLLALSLSGTLSLSARAELDACLENLAGRLLHLRIERNEVLDAPTEDDLATLHTDGFVGAAAERLRQSDSESTEDALRLLFRFLKEEAPE